MQLTPEEKTLLLYFESAIMESGGILEVSTINESEMNIVNKWHKEFFIKVGQVATHDTNGEDKKMWCEFSKKAWDCAKTTRSGA